MAQWLSRLKENHKLPVGKVDVTGSRAGERLLTTIIALISMSFEGSRWPWVQRNLVFEAPSGDGMEA
jgi:hypothetical protein